MMKRGPHINAVTGVRECRAQEKEVDRTEAGALCSTVLYLCVVEVCFPIDRRFLQVWCFLGLWRYWFLVQRFRYVRIIIRQRL